MKGRTTILISYSATNFVTMAAVLVDERKPSQTTNMKIGVESHALLVVRNIHRRIFDNNEKLVN